MPAPLAHSGGHLLSDHLEAVAALAAEFSSDFETSEPLQRWAYLAGLWHDLGKYRPGFQKYVRLADNPDAHIEGKVAGAKKPIPPPVRSGPSGSSTNRANRWAISWPT